VDIAGLVQGASQGEGLGNQFLSHIREVDAVVHVIRCFDDPDVVHVMGPVDPVRDHDVITSELALADLAVVERRLDKTRKTARAGDKDAQTELVVLERVLAELNAGRGAREAGESEEAVRFLRQLGLLTAKPILYAANVNEPDLAAGGGAWLDKLRAAVQAHHEEAEIVLFPGKLAAELCGRGPTRRPGSRAWCAVRGGITWSRTATSCCSGSTCRGTSSGRSADQPANREHRPRIRPPPPNPTLRRTLRRGPAPFARPMHA